MSVLQPCRAWSSWKKPHSYSALLTTSCYHNASSGCCYLDLDKTDWERRCSHIGPAPRHWTPTLETWSSYFPCKHVCSQNMDCGVLSSHLHHMSRRCVLQQFGKSGQVFLYLIGVQLPNFRLTSMDLYHDSCNVRGTPNSSRPFTYLYKNQCVRMMWNSVLLSLH